MSRLPKRTGKVAKARRKRTKGVAFVLAGGRCYLCTKRLTLRTMTLDHVLPKCRGGGDSPKINLRAACRPCNEGKGDWSYTEMLLGFRLNRVTT